MERCRIESPWGPLGVSTDGEALTALNLRSGEDCPPPEAPILREAAAQLAAYFDGKLRDFDLPLAPAGTEFQQRVWQGLCEIPYGTTLSYGELAERLGSPGGMRAVGQANNKNPIAIVIPCHRVIGADGSLTGFGGGMDLKVELLRLEGAIAPTLF